MDTLGWQPSEFSKSSAAGRRTWTMEATPCVDLLIDGVSLEVLVRRAMGTRLDGMVSLLDIEPVEGDSVDVLTGAVVYEDWLPPGARVPLLVCDCGDLMCGALTASVEEADGQFSFRDWGWENYYEDIEPVALEDMVFDASNLRAVATEAMQWSRAHRADPLTVVSVTGPDSVLIGPMPWHRKGRRITEKRMRRALAATRLEVNRTGDEEFDAYVADVIAMAGREPQGAESEGTAIASRLLASPYVDRLPGPTVTALEWFRDQECE